MEKPLAVKVTEAARLTTLHPWTIRQYIKNGRLRAVRCGRRLVVPISALEDFLRGDAKKVA